MDRNCVLVSLFHGSERAATAGWTKRAAATTRRRGNRRINTFTLIVFPVAWPMVFCFHTVTCQELVSMKTLPDDLYDTRQSLHGPQLLPLPLLPELAGCALSCPQRHG